MMRPNGKQIIPLLILITIIGVVTACNSTEVSVPEQTVEKAPPGLAAFQITNLAINPSEVYTGVEVIITAEVTNISDTEDDYTAKLRIEDVTRASLPAFRYLNEVTIAAGESQLMSFLVSKDKQGTYKVTWDDLTGEFVVVQPVLTQPNDSESATSKSTIAPDPNKF